MNRRSFIRNTTISTIGLSLQSFDSVFKDKSQMGIVVHSYANRWRSKIPSTKYPGFQNALSLLDHCHQIGAGGLQVMVDGWNQDFTRQVRERREKLGLYLEGSLALPKKTEDLPRFENEVRQAREAGAEIIRTVCLNGRRYENFHYEEEFNQFKQNALKALQEVEPILRKNRVRLAIENHKDWRAQELVNLLHTLSSEWMGVTLDFGNNIALMEDPVDVVKILSPYIFSTHVKDMATEESPDGFLLSEVPLGKGNLDLPKMVELCKKQNPAVRYNLEMITRDPLRIPCLEESFWSTLNTIQAIELVKLLKEVKGNKYGSSLPKPSTLSGEDRLALEEENILISLDYSRKNLEPI